MRKGKGQNLLIPVTDYTVIDLETTDKNPRNARIIELSAIRVRNDTAVEAFSQLVDPKMHIPRIVSELTGITDDMVKNMPTIDMVLGQYLDFISDDVILGHNIASYDTTILCEYADVFLHRSFENDMIDTLNIAQYHCGLDLPNYKLSTLAEYYEIVNEHAHRALSDCYTNLEVYKKLKRTFKSSRYSTGSREQIYTYDIAKDTVSTCSFSDHIYIPLENLNLQGKNIVITGDFTFGSRGAVESFLTSKGANIKKSVNKMTDFLIIGSQASNAYKFGNYGNKTADALNLIDSGYDIKIMFEKDFFGKLGD